MPLCNCFPWSLSFPTLNLIKTGHAPAPAAVVVWAGRMGAETINLSSLRIEPAIFGRVIIPLKVEGAAAGFLKDGLTARRALDTSRASTRSEPNPWNRIENDDGPPKSCFLRTCGQTPS